MTKLPNCSLQWLTDEAEVDSDSIAALQAENARHIALLQSNGKHFTLVGVCLGHLPARCFLFKLV